ncbi:MAG: hypothetical protein ACRDPC_15915 [Solirubrobacteraceae bacterium]
MSITFAHVAGIPLEEGLPTLAPAACALAVLVTARLRGFVAWLRRR